MKKLLNRKNKLIIKKNYSLLSYTTFRIGGKAEYFCKPGSLDLLIQALNYANEKKINVNFIGGGSNVLVSDAGINGLVISTLKLNRCKIKNSFVEVECGLSIDTFNKKLLKYSLTGMEFSGGLPGSIGGAVYMNARSYGGQFSDYIHSVYAIDMADRNKLKIFTNRMINFGYKKSLFMENKNLFIYKILLNLKKGEYPKIRNEYKRNKKDRKIKGQFIYPSAGCVFKNDYSLNLITGKLIDELGLKGKTIGKAKIFEKHGNFIINTGGAKSDDVKDLIELIEKKVYDEKKIKLQREIRLLGY